MIMANLFTTIIIMATLMAIIINQCSITQAFWTSVSDSLQSPSSSSQQQQQLNPHHYKNRDMQLEDLLSQGEEKCLNKPCVQSEQCCPGSVCVDLHSSSVTGTCVPIYGVNEGDSCLDDGDCETGLKCIPNQQLSSADSGSGSSSSSSSSSNQQQQQQQQLLQQQPSGTCQPPGQEMVKKQYNEDCTTSSQCDSSRGLCCQLIKRHRMAPRRACLYFSDPKVCLGPVDVTFARPASSNYHNYYKTGERDYFRARIG